MPLADGSHVRIGDQPWLLDEGYEQLLGRRCYIHGGRDLFTNRTDITGKPGAQNVKSNDLIWTSTDFAGEGQVSIDPSDESSAFRFYRSEGLDFRTAGQFSLNKSVLSETVSSSPGADVTKQGNPDFIDLAGVSTTPNADDRTLVDVGDQIGMSANYTPGVGITQADFYIYRDDFTAYGTVIEATDFTKYTGNDASVSGSDLQFSRQAGYVSPLITSFTAGQTYRVEYTASITPAIYNNEGGVTIAVTEIPVAGSQAEKVVATKSLVLGADSPPIPGFLTWTPKNGKVYRLRFQLHVMVSGSIVTFDKVQYGLDPGTNIARIEIYKETAVAGTVDSKEIVIDATSAGSLVGSVTFPTAAATNYRARITRTQGNEAIIVNQVVLHPLSSIAWTLDCIDFGLGGKVWLGAHATASDSAAFTYTPASDTWTAAATFNQGAVTTNYTVRAMAHSDSAEYFLLSGNEVYTSTAGGADDRYANFSGNARTCVGLCVAQNRVWVLTEDGSTGGNYVFSLPLDDTSTALWDMNTAALSTGVRYVQIPTGSKTPDTTLRQRMCSTPTGARFFVNFGDVTSKVYEVDGSGTTLEPRELADLGHGVKATSICHESGITFIGAQYYGDALSSDTDKLPRAALFVIDQNGAVQRIGFFRRDDPDPNPPVFMVPYQTHLYILQGRYVWRYDLVRGGLFLEYELNPTSANADASANQRALAVLFGSVFVLYTQEVFVAGSVGTYRQSSVEDGSTFTTSVYDYGLPFARKTLTKINVLADNLPVIDGIPNTRVVIEYQVDQNNTWLQAGQFDTGSDATFYITDTNFITLQLRARLSTTDGASTPVVRAITAWSSSAQDEEYFDLVLFAEDYDGSFRISDEQSEGGERVAGLLQAWLSKSVLTFRDGYQSSNEDYTDYLVTVEDLRIEFNMSGEGRIVITLKVVR